jgi:uncharacterized integral membrane protein
VPVSTGTGQQAPVGPEVAPTHQPVRAERTRTSSAWIAISVALIFLVLLIIFIAQNSRSVPLHFFIASGTAPEALVLLVASVVGACVVLAVGIGRIAQLRLTQARHNRSGGQRGA